MTEKNSDDEATTKTVGLVFKDWVTIFLSIVAVLLSAATAFWTIARVEENLSVVVRGAQLAFHSGPKSVVAEGGESDLLFVNSGNRPVGILAVHIYFLTENGPKICEKSQPTQRFTTNFRPIVVKENEIVPSKIKIDGIYSPNQPAEKFRTVAQRAVLDISDDIAKKTEIKAVSCLFVQLSTPSVALHSASAFISEFAVIGDKAFFNPTDAEETRSGGPQSLYSHFGNIFERPVQSKPQEAKAASQK